METSVSRRSVITMKNTTSDEHCKRCKISMDRVVTTIEKYGNTTAATIPIALAEAVRAGRIIKGDIIIFASFGSGFTWASTIMRW